MTPHKLVKFLVVSFCAALVCLGACTSRYRMDLYMSAPELGRKKVKVESREFIREAVLNEPYAEDKIVPGNGNVIVLEVGTRGERMDVDETSVIGYDEYVRVRLFFLLPYEVVADTIPLEERSFARMLGRFDLSPDKKIFLPESGRLVIDSLADDHIFTTVTSRYINTDSLSMSFDGRVKIRYR